MIPGHVVASAFPVSIPSRPHGGRQQRTGNVAQHRQHDVDQQVAAAAALEEDAQRREEHGEQDLDDVAVCRERVSVGGLWGGGDGGEVFYLPVKGMVGSLGWWIGFWWRTAVWRAATLECEEESCWGRMWMAWCGMADGWRKRRRGRKQEEKTSGDSDLFIRFVWGPFPGPRDGRGRRPGSTGVHAQICRPASTSSLWLSESPRRDSLPRSVVRAVRGLARGRAPH